MAEFVQQNIEHMLPELEMMARVKLFTTHETRAILKQRKAHEYRMRRRTKVKEDFLRYIQYEINVLALIRKRRRKFEIQHKKYEIDLAIVQRVHSLFRMACHRFQEDENLWLSHIDFAKKRGEKTTVSRLMLRMLQVHSRKAELWLLAAQWEFETNRSSENARTLFQRGLRFNPDSKELWAEYYRMELLNVDKIRKRRQALGLEERMDNDDEDTIEEDDAVLEGRIAQIVFEKGLEAFPNDVDICLAFITICAEFDFTTKMQEQMLEVLKTNYPMTEDCWIFLAEKEGGLYLKEKRCGLDAVFDLECRKAQVLLDACEKLKTEKIWSALIQFWSRQVQRKSSVELRQKRIEKCLEAYDSAEENGILTSQMKVERIEFLQKFSIEGVKRYCELGTKQHPESIQLWTLRIENLIEGDHTVDLIVDLFKRSLATIEGHECSIYWSLVLDFLSEKQSQHLVPLLELGSKSNDRGVATNCKTRHLQYAYETHGLKTLRKAFNTYSESGPLNAEFFDYYIRMERNEATPKVPRIRKAYDLHADLAGKESVDLWIEYIKFEMEIESKDVHSEPRSSQVHWKALRTLTPEMNEEFVRRYTILSN